MAVSHKISLKSAPYQMKGAPMQMGTWGHGGKEEIYLEMFLNGPHKLKFPYFIFKIYFNVTLHFVAYQHYLSQILQ